MATIKKSIKKIKKAQNGAPIRNGERTADSSNYYTKKILDNIEAGSNLRKAGVSEKNLAGYTREAIKAEDNLDRQSYKGMAGFDKNGFPVLKKKNGGKMAKAKSGGSFPDLNKDGKITKADILKGRGVIAKKGAKVGKAKMGCMSCGGKMKKK